MTRNEMITRCITDERDQQFARAKLYKENGLEEAYLVHEMIGTQIDMMLDTVVALRSSKVEYIEAR